MDKKSDQDKPTQVSQKKTSFGKSNRISPDLTSAKYLSTYSSNNEKKGPKADKARALLGLTELEMLSARQNIKIREASWILGLDEIETSEAIKSTPKNKKP